MNIRSNSRLNWKSMTRPAEDTRGAIIKAAVHLPVLEKLRPYRHLRLASTGGRYDRLKGCKNRVSLSRANV
jgi:hypothetical protein